MNPILSIITAMVKPVANVFTAREERKKAKINAEGKAAQSKINGENKITLTDAEWESINISQQNASWKDEYVTLVITSPIVAVLFGGLWLAFKGDDRVLIGMSSAFQSLENMGLNLGELMYDVVLAAVGLKLWRAGK